MLPSRFALNLSISNFSGQTVVLPNGEVIKTKRRARRSATGFDTTSLFIGAEGTLGIVTEGTVAHYVEAVGALSILQ